MAERIPSIGPATMSKVDFALKCSLRLELE